MTTEAGLPIETTPSRDVGNAPQIESVRVADLRPHPLQSELFSDLPADEFAALVDDLRQNGQREPIRIRSDRTILCGHQRVGAARELGWDSVQAIVVDFDNEDDALLLVVSDNVRRRHLGPIALARIYATLAKSNWAEGRQPGTDLRDEIARRLGAKCGRTLDRYCSLLKLPQVLVQAVESRQLAMSAGFKIRKLPAVVQEKIASEIEAGQEVEEVVARHLRGRNGDDVDQLRERYRRMLVELRTGMRIVNRRLKDVVGFGPESNDAIAVARDACKFLKRVITAEKRRQVQCAKRLDQRLARFARDQPKTHRG